MLCRRPLQFTAWRFALLVFCFAAAGSHCYAQVPRANIDFAREIRPLLSDRCFACHGPDAETREAELRLDDLSRIDEDRGGYQIVSPGHADDSELLRRIFSEDESEVMPPPHVGKPLSMEEKQFLKRWVDAGAHWNQHWAYVTPIATPTPQLDQADSQFPQARNWIDAYVARKLHAAGAGFSAQADTVTLARRLSFDLTGLPPSPESIADLQAAATDQALDRYVEQLLASPAVGERLAILWLDLVRYADTVGYHGDQDHNISPYRDYVIDAFNDDKPFDQFTIEQLAGDLLDNPTQEQRIATSYNRLLQTSHEGGVQPQEYLTIYAADRVRNLSAVWLGATVGCAQCHDHKYDPFTARDFYSFVAFFADVDEAQHFQVGGNSLPTNRPPEEAFLDRRDRAWLEHQERQLMELDRQLLETGDRRDARHDATSPAAEKATAEAQRARARDALRDSIEATRQSARKCMITVSITPRDIRYLPRGNWLDESGDIMLPSIPNFLGELDLDAARRATRLDLARWLVDTDSGGGLLTARVFVNRLWMMLFGAGLSRSVDDFGGQGEAPSHPELLDRLAIEFVRSGGDVKHLLRVITGSATYRQASLETDWQREQDSTNRLLSRQNRFRLPAETIRDVALMCGGLLVREVGGPSIKPYQPAGYYRHLNFPTREYSDSTDEGQWRRGVYVHWQRQFLHPMLRAFDAPSREECTALRPQSNTPLAALVWLNDPSFVEAARGLAGRVLADSDVSHDASRIAGMFALATSRQPDRTETELLQKLLDSARVQYAQSPANAASLQQVGLLHLHSGVPADELAAWTTVARAVLNLNETYTRN